MLIGLSNVRLKIVVQLERHLDHDFHTMHHLFWRSRAMQLPILQVMVLGLCVTRCPVQIKQLELCVTVHDIHITIGLLSIRFLAEFRQRTILCTLCVCLTFFLLFVYFVLEIKFIK